MKQNSHRKSYVGGTNLKRGTYTASQDIPQRYKEMERMGTEFLRLNGYNADGSPIRPTRH